MDGNDSTKIVITKGLPKMGEAKRRDTFTGQLLTVSSSDNSERSLFYSVLASIADGLDAQLLLKEIGDDLLDWPVGAIVGVTPWSDAARACPVALETRRTSDHFEFQIPDGLLITGYCALACARGLAFPGPIHPSEFPARARALFEEHAGGWASVVPARWGEFLTARDGRPN
jgi:hypothetical protein